MHALLVVNLPAIASVKRPSITIMITAIDTIHDVRKFDCDGCALRPRAVGRNPCGSVWKHWLRV
jgi:hypothetical protein